MHKRPWSVYSSVRELLAHTVGPLFSTNQSAPVRIDWRPRIFLTLALFSLTACQAISPAAADQATPVATEEVAALPSDQAAVPVKLAVPELNLEMPVVEMGWAITEVDGERTTEWIVPTDAIGWHANSAGAGVAGNTILSGYQMTGEALLAPLATGELVVGQEVQLTAADGKVFTYQISEVTEPIAITGATEAEVARAAAYIAPTEEPQLTLITGWPDFTTTHRVFAVAEFVGEAN